MTEATPKKSHAPWRRWVRRIVWGVLGLVALVVLLVGGALFFLTTPSGELWLRDKVVPIANEQISGKLEVGSLDLSLSGLTVRDLKLYTPEGELVAEVALVDARLLLAPLALQHVELTSARIERPRLYLVQDERGLNLSRAIEPRTPKPEEPDQGRGSLRLTLRDFRLEDGYVDFEADAPEGTRQVRLEDLDANGSASYGAAKRSFNARLEATGGLSRPVTGPVKVSLQGQGEEENLSSDVNLTVAGLEVAVRGGMRGMNEAWMELKRLSLAPDTARAFLPSYPLLVPVSLEGNAQKQGDVARASLDARAGKATLDLDGSFNIATLRSDGLTLQARDIDLAELVENGPTTSIVASLTARGGGTSLETLDGDVELNISPSKFKQQPLGPVELRASAKDGNYLLSRLRVLVPGASLDASGQGSVDKIQVKGSLSASNLAVLAQTVGKLGPGPALPMTGAGALDFQVEGPLRAPGVELSGTFASLGYADTQIQNLNLKAALPDVTRPLTVDASLVVGELRTGGRTLQNVSAVIATKERALQAIVRTAGDIPLSLDVAGTVDEDQQGLALKALTLAYPEATWTLQGPTHVGFGGGHIQVKPALRLASDAQSLAVTLDMEGERVDGLVDVGALDLTRLPKSVVPETLKLGGVLSARVSARGRLPRPDAELSVTLVDGRFQEYSDIDVSLKGTYVKDRATGTLSAEVPAARVTADFDVPVQGVLRRRRDELNLKVNLARLNIEEVRKLLNRPEPVTGELTGTLVVTGPAREPKLSFTLSGEGLHYDDKASGVTLPPLAFKLNAASDETDGTLDARLEVQGLGPQTYVALQTPFTMGQLLEKPPTADEVMRARVQLEARANELPLTLLAGMGGVQKPGGTVSLAVDMAGTALVPQGKLEVLAKGATVNGLPPQDGTLTVTAGAADIRMALSVLQRKGEGTTPLAELSATLGAPLGALQDPDVIGWVPFDLKGRLHPTPLIELPGLATADPALRERGLQGVISLEFTARGTPAAPQVDLTAGLQKLGVGTLALGQARIHYGYSDARSQLDALVTAPAGGTLLLKAGIPLDLSLPAVQQGLEVNRVPLDVTLVARQFDMGFLSGAHEMVRSLGGVLEADAHVAGSVGAPTLQGKVNWNNGLIGLMGFGEYRDIRVNLAVTQERIQLQELFARAGSGEVRMKADAKLSGGRAYELTGDAQLKDFPIISEDQLVAITSLNATMEGTLSNELVNIRNLNIPEAHITLPEVARKDLQPLQRPGDIVLVRNGVPVEKRRRKKAEPAKNAPALGTGGKDSPAGDASAQLPTTDPTKGGTGTGGAGATAPVEDAVDTEEEEEEVLRTYRLLVNAPRNIWVKGSDVNIELGLSPGFEVSYTDEPFLSGEVIVQRGRVSALGRRFDVQKDSKVTFTGPPLAPYLNITAEHQNERENVTVFVHIRGQGKDFTIEPTSEPPMSETEIYTLLATGRSTLERNSGASMTAGAQAASVVGSLVASQAKKAIAAELPLDVFSIEAGEGGLAGTKLEVGTYLTDKIYVGYTGRVGVTAQDRENANAVRFEYQFSPQWSLEANYGDARSGGLDLIWSKEY
ncbi:translocation/assembly module TamB domain-containing protein [Hyalangium rubrum]|uniref:Translocation/assembly module TamB domain-containing protein n=1 Tax=Hyalangium rubrum TaxID=3103134 RepID=A0ABU5H1Y3_9BACT|nr:translocation/assembly module TamB domain-containing protein [Hyalangium sp. s54d21]MDY7227466.1 translocation/assembly module TamB domain-containing protein [Hyalangium sp. s54d21]